MNISGNATKYLQLFGKNRDNAIVPAQLRMAEMSTKKLKKLRKALTHGKIKENDFTREIANLDEPIYGNGKTTDTKCVAQIGNYMVIDSELNGD